MVPSILGIGILELFYDITVKWIISSEKIDPHSEYIFYIFVVRMVCDGRVVFCYFEEVLFVYFNCFSSQFAFLTVNQQENQTEMLWLKLVLNVHSTASSFGSKK